MYAPGLDCVRKGTHLHQFTIGETRYATPDSEDDPEHPVVDERRVKLRDVLEQDLEFAYLYDFGDDWHHQINVEQVEPLNQPAGHAHVTDGACACPPEDCGGAYGYQEFLNELAAKPRSEAVKEFLTWAGHDFRPERFDRHAANAALLRMAWNRWGER